MTYHKKAVLIILALVILLTLGWARQAQSTQEREGEILATSTEAIIEGPSDEEILLEKRKAWLEELVLCESGGDPAAINAVDRDGTASYGLLQFKPDTFYGFAEAYGIEYPEGNQVMPSFMDPDAQRAIVMRMMEDPSVDWLQQFPQCVREFIGFPPGTVIH